MAIEATVGARVGDYILVKKLGEGGMAEVWLARHAGTAQLRAIKFLNRQFQGMPEVEARFQTEGESQLVHPNIVRIYEVGQFQGSSFLVMDFIDGRDLEKILDSRRGPLTVPESVDISMQILAGLGFAHQSGIIHRDIKPSNVLVDSEGQAYLMDFGIAKALRGTRSVTQVNSRLGTPDYMSPEQIRNPRDVDRRSDIYSFGCMFYELLTGWPPFDRGAGYETEHDIKTAHVTALPTPPVERKPGIPAPLNEIALHCLAKAKEDRPQSCEEILGALDAYRLSVQRPQPPRVATVVDDAPVPRRSTEVVSDSGVAGSPYSGQPGFPQNFGGAIRTPTVTDDAIRAQSDMVANGGGHAFGELPPVPQLVPTPVQPAVPQAKSNRTMVMVAGGIMLLAALGGGGYLALHKEPPPPEPDSAQPKDTGTKAGQGSGQGPGQTADTNGGKQAITPFAPHQNPTPAGADKRVLIVGEVPAGGPEAQIPAGMTRWQRVQVSHKSLPACAELATSRPVAYVANKADVAQILKQHPELAGAASGTEMRPLSPDVVARCGAYDAVLIMANAPQQQKLASGTLIWSGDPTALGNKHIIIIRSANQAMPGGLLNGPMFPAKPIKVTVRPAGAATIVLPDAKTNFNTLDLFVPNPGQQTIYLDWTEVPNP